MAKRINILNAGTTVPFADGGLKLSKSIKISEIENHPDFQSLFKIDEELLERITSSINENGFDASQPVHIWIKEDEEETHKYLIDGYTRLSALRKAGHETVPYFEHKFETFEEAYKYVLGLQVNRRNLESSELLRNVSKLLGTDFIQNTEGKKSEAIAEILGVSDRTVEKAIAVSENADEDTLAKIEAGALSVNKAYKQEKAKKKTERNDTDGNPQSVTVRSRDMSEYYNPPKESDIDARLIERYKEGFVDGFKKAASELSYEVYDKICKLLEKGKNLEEIQNDETFADFTFTEIAPKLNIPIEADEILKEYNK